jgi:hypothetical protein
VQDQLCRLGLAIVIESDDGIDNGEKVILIAFGEDFEALLSRRL